MRHARRQRVEARGEGPALVTAVPTVESFLASGRPEDPLIKNGRYQIVPANGEKAKPHTRITNFAKKLEDEFNLTKWKQRQVLLGAAQRSDIIVGALADGDDKKKLDELAEQAQDAAKSNVKRETGTALHRIIERVDAGEDLKLPEPWASDVAAYKTALASISAEVELIEQVVVCKSLNLAGRFDRTVIIDGVRYMGDLKTGDDLSYSWGSIDIQLALYAGADTIYDPDTKKHRPMPPVDQSRALVMHLPAGKGVCDLYWLPLEAGRRGIQLTSQLLEWRKATKKLPFKDHTEHLQARAELRDYVEAKVRHLLDGGHGDELAGDWPPDVPTLKASDSHSEAQLDKILLACDVLEGHRQLPFSALTDPRRS